MLCFKLFKCLHLRRSWYLLFNSIKQYGSYSSRYAVGKQVSHVVEQTVLSRSVSKTTHAGETGWQNGI